MSKSIENRCKAIFSNTRDIKFMDWQKCLEDSDNSKDFIENLIRAVKYEVITCPPIAEDYLNERDPHCNISMAIARRLGHKNPHTLPDDELATLLLQKNLVIEIVHNCDKISGAFAD